MPTSPRGAACTLAAAAAVVAAATPPNATAGQVRTSLQVTVRVVAACGGSSAGGTATPTAACPAASAPLALVTESAPVRTGGATPSVETSGEVRYLTLIY